MDDQDTHEAREEARRTRAALADAIALALADDVPRESPAWWGYYYAIKFLGIHVVHELFRESVEIQARGGMTTVDGSRKRTLGGVFFVLSKKRLGAKQMGIIRGRIAVKTGIPVGQPSPMPATETASDTAACPPSATCRKSTPPNVPHSASSASPRPERAKAPEPEVVIARRRGSRTA